jgi:hypothetical protein
MRSPGSVSDEQAVEGKPVQEVADIGMEEITTFGT